GVGCLPEAADANPRPESSTWLISCSHHGEFRFTSPMTFSVLRVRGSERCGHTQEIYHKGTRNTKKKEPRGRSAPRLAACASVVSRDVLSALAVNPLTRRRACSGSPRTPCAGCARWPAGP